MHVHYTCKYDVYIRIYVQTRICVFEILSLSLYMYICASVYMLIRMWVARPYIYVYICSHVLYTKCPKKCEIHDSS